MAGLFRAIFRGLASISKIRGGTAQLIEINRVTLLVTVLFGVAGLMYAHLSYKSGQSALELGRQPYGGENAFFVTYEDERFVLEKSPTKEGGFLEIFFCQQGFGMTSLASLEFPQRAISQPLPEVDVPDAEVNHALPISYLIHVWNDDDAIETNYHRFDGGNFMRMKSKNVKDYHLVCAEIY